MKQSNYYVYGKTGFLCYTFMFIKRIKIWVSVSKRSSFKFAKWLYWAKEGGGGIMSLHSDDNEDDDDEDNDGEIFFVIWLTYKRR